MVAKVFQMAQPLSIAHRLRTPVRQQEVSVGPAPHQDIVISGISTKTSSSLAEAPYEKYSMPKMKLQEATFSGPSQEPRESEKPNFRDVQFYEVIMEALLDAGL